MAKQFQHPKVPKCWTLMQRINHYTNRTVNKSECWLWMASKDQEGYALLWWKGKQRRASRLLCQARGNQLTDKLVVMHTCDNPSCMNPHHLIVGTVSDNAIDAFSKGRRQALRGKESYLSGKGHLWAGEKHGAACLTWPIVREIRASRRLFTQRYLAEKYGVSQTMISRIQLIKAWHPKHDPQTGSSIKE